MPTNSELVKGKPHLGTLFAQVFFAQVVTQKKTPIDMELDWHHHGSLLLLPASYMLHMWLACLKIALHFPCLSVALCVPNTLIVYVVAMQLDFGQLDGCF